MEPSGDLDRRRSRLVDKEQPLRQTEERRAPGTEFGRGREAPGRDGLDVAVAVAGLRGQPDQVVPTLLPEHFPDRVLHRQSRLLTDRQSVSQPQRYRLTERLSIPLGTITGTKLKPTDLLVTRAPTPYGRWLQARCAERGWTSVRQAAGYIGINYEVLRTHLLGKFGPSVESIRTVADYFKVDRDWLEALSKQRDSQTEGDVLILRERDLNVAAGDGSEYEGQTWRYAPEPADRGHHFEVHPVRGNCLSPTVNDRERVIVDYDAGPTHGDVVLAVIEGASVLRLYVWEHGCFWLKAYRDHSPVPASEAKVLGVVKNIQRHPKAYGAYDLTGGQS